jgi:hypothetical protein
VDIQVRHVNANSGIKLLPNKYLNEKRKENEMHAENGAHTLKALK